jgi:hypothetical protein
MRWYQRVAYFFRGAFLANTLPRLGVFGHNFQSPFRVTARGRLW